MGTKEVLTRHRETATVSGVIAAIIYAVSTTGGSLVFDLDGYVNERVTKQVEIHLADAGHLTPELIAYQSIEAEDGLSQRIDEYVRIQCETGRNLRKEIKEKRKLYRKITGETYDTPSCDEV